MAHPVFVVPDWKVSISFAALPANALLSGKVLDSLGTDERNERIGYETVLKFKRIPVSELVKFLERTSFDKLVVSAIAFA